MFALAGLFRPLDRSLGDDRQIRRFCKRCWDAMRQGVLVAPPGVEPGLLRCGRSRFLYRLGWNLEQRGDDAASGWRWASLQRPE
jgi:hypothetical protein